MEGLNEVSAKNIMERSLLSYLKEISGGVIKFLLYAL